MKALICYKIENCKELVDYSRQIFSLNIGAGWKVTLVMYLSNFKHNKKSMLSIILEGHVTSHEMEGHTTLPTCVYLLELKWKGLFQNFLEVFWGFRKVSQFRGG